jgi:hypothetical protein
MRITLYFFASLLLITLVGALAYSINSSKYPVDMFGLHFTFPVAVWVIIPMLVLLAASVAHMMYYGLKIHFKLKRWVKDIDTLKDALYWAILKEPQKHKYLKHEMRDGAVILDSCHIDVDSSAEGLDDRFVRALEIVKDINNGQYVEIKDKKLRNVLSDNNPLMIQNTLNRLNVSSEFVETVLRSKESYDTTVVEQALSIFFQKATFSEALKYASLMQVKHLYMMLDRVDAGEKIGFDEIMVNKFVEALDFDCEDYMRLAQTTMKKFAPHVNISLFDSYRKDENIGEKAENAYINMLFEYEKVEDIQDFLEEQRDDEYAKYRALLELKRQNFHFKLEDFIDKSRVCH